MTTTTSSYPVNPEAVQAMKQFLEALGLDLTALGMEKTPYRVAEAFGQFFSGLKENPDVEIDICGYADHTGGEAINKKVTEKRAEALKKWLVKVGIEEDRLHTYGLGKDRVIEKELRYSVKARRTEVKGKE